MKLKLLAGCSAAAFCLTVGVAAAQQVQFTELDTNADKSLTVEEFSAGLDKTKILTQFDTNADGSIDQTEFQAGTDLVFKADMDANKFDKTRYGEFAAWDKNSDGKLDKTELGAGLYGYLNTDTDAAMMTEAEFSAGSSILTTQ